MTSPRWILALVATLALAGCSFDSQVTAFVSVKGFSVDGTKLIPDYSFEFQPAGTGFQGYDLKLPANFSEALSFPGYNVANDFSVSPGFTEASAATTPLTLNTGYPLGEQDFPIASELGGTYHVHLRFVADQKTHFDVPNAVYWKLHPATVGKYSLKASDNNDRGEWLYGPASTLVSQDYSGFRELTGEAVYVEVLVSYSPRVINYLTSTGTLLATKTPFGPSGTPLTFAPGLVIDLSTRNF